MAKRRRPATLAAAAPNSSSIGGAGTSVPLEVEVLVEVLVSVPLEVEVLVDDEVELDEVTLPDDEVDE